MRIQMYRNYSLYRTIDYSIEPIVWGVWFVNYNLFPLKNIFVVVAPLIKIEDGVIMWVITYSEATELENNY